MIEPGIIGLLSTINAVLAWLQSRTLLTPEEYYDKIPAAARAGGFTVSGLASLDQIQGTLDLLTQAVAQGQSFRTWQAAMAEAQPSVFALPRYRLANIYRTNIQTAYGAGRARQQEQPAVKARRPFAMYDAVNDSRTRETHAAMDGFIAPIDDPIWLTWTPPNGYQCRCVRITLNPRQAIARGYKEGTPAPDVTPDKGFDVHPLDSDGLEGIIRAVTDRRARSFQAGPLSIDSTTQASALLDDAIKALAGG